MYPVSGGVLTLYGALFACYDLIANVTGPGGCFVLLRVCCVKRVR